MLWGKDISLLVHLGSGSCKIKIAWTSQRDDSNNLPSDRIRAGVRRPIFLWTVSGHLDTRVISVHHQPKPPKSHQKAVQSVSSTSEKSGTHHALDCPSILNLNIQGCGVGWDGPYCH
jgi:hypothetical protein